MNKGEFLYEGKAKRIYRTDDENLYCIEFKDDATAFDGKKKGTISDKGVLNNKISSYFFTLLKDKGIPTHFIRQLSDREMLVKGLKIIQVEVVVRNIAAGSLSKRTGLKEGTVLPRPVVEYYYKNDELGDPLFNEDHIDIMELVTGEKLAQIKGMALEINTILREHLRTKDIELVDFKLEFGVSKVGEILLGDEISPDTCRFWDMQTYDKLDKDRFRHDLGRVEDAYREVWKRLNG